MDEARAPNVKQYLRGLRNYYVLAQDIKVRMERLSGDVERPYNYYNLIMGVGIAYMGTRYMRHNMTKTVSDG